MKLEFYNNKPLYIVWVVFVLIVFQSCKDVRGNVTTLEVIDNNRHYYPILRGQTLDVVFDIKNTGKYPFLMSELLPSCGCVVSKKSSIGSIPPGSERRIILTYDSSKNIGYVEHFIDIYGNLETEKISLIFDTHVVPNSDYTRDYEEIYSEKIKKSGNFKSMTDGKENNKGYYLD